MTFITDENNNPAAITTDIAKEGGLIEGTDYIQGTSFYDRIPEAAVATTHPGLTYKFITYYTAKLLGDPVALTIQVIDKIGYYTNYGQLRWIYIAIPSFIWNQLNFEDKRDVIGFHYQHEGGTEMKHLFPNYGKK